MAFKVSRKKGSEAAEISDSGSRNLGASFCQSETVQSKRIVHYHFFFYFLYVQTVEGLASPQVPQNG
jgi:hypothetical protein